MPNDVRLLEMLIGELQVLFPIEFGHVMFAAANMVADGGVYRLICFGLLWGSQRRLAQQIVNGTCMKSGKEFPFGIGPAIIFCAGNIDGPWCDQCDQLMLIDGEA